MEEKTILIKEKKSLFKVAGNGQPVLILHGWGASSSSWEKVQNILAYNDYKVYCPDLPGFGKTDSPEKAWGVSDYVDWVSEFAKSQNLDNFILIGHSFGGRISIKFANYYPKKVKALILCDSAGLKVSPSFKRRVVLTFVGFLKLIFGITFFKKIKEEMKELFFFAISSTDYAKASKVMRETMKRVLAEDLFIYLNGIKNKTLIVWGKKDKLVPVEHAYVFKEQIQDSRLEIISGVGHSPHLKVPDKLSDIVLNFLKN